MITKSIVKEYVQRRCPYLAKASLNDNTLLNLIKKLLEFKKLEDIDDIKSDSDFDGESDNPNEGETIDVVEIMRDYPHLRSQIQFLIEENERTNPLRGLLAKYDDTQVTARLSRRYIELIYGEEVCRRCDVNDFGCEDLNQKMIVNRTKEYLEDNTVKVLFEGQIEHGNLRARFDVLIKEDDGSLTLIEAKGSNTVYCSPKKEPDVQTKIKTSYLFDLLFQYYLYDKSGLKISKLGFMYLNKEFTLTEGNENYPDLSDEDVQRLYKLTFEMNYKPSRKKVDPKIISLKEYIDNEMYVEMDKDEYKVPPIEDVINDLETINKSEHKSLRHYECVKGGKCPFILECFPEAEDADSIFKLTRWNLYGGKYQKSRDLIKDNCFSISKIPTDIVNSIDEASYDKETGQLKRFNNIKSQIKFQNEWKNKDFKYVIRMDLLKDILHSSYENELVDYLVFFDFESIQNPVPLMDDAYPWQQVVTQYSMHIVSKDYDLTKHDFAKGRGGNCSHYEFIGHPRKDCYKNPEFDLFKTLREQLIDFGVDPMAKNYKVIVFNKNFECTRMNEFVRLYQSNKNVDADLVNFVINFNDNVVDLLDFFTMGSFYGKEFKGRGSLKVVQPRLCEDEDVLAYYNKLGLPFDLAYSLDYHKGDQCLVYNGAICLDLYKALLVRSHTDHLDNNPDEDKMLAEALAYCKIDSWGTVIIYDILKNVAKGRIKLKALYL